MDRNVDQTEVLLSLKTENDADKNKTATTTSTLLLEDFDGLENIWTKTNVGPFEVYIVHNAALNSSDNLPS